MEDDLMDMGDNLRMRDMAIFRTISPLLSLISCKDGMEGGGHVGWSHMAMDLVITTTDRANFTWASAPHASSPGPQALSLILLAFWALLCSQAHLSLRLGYMLGPAQQLGLPLLQHVNCALNMDIWQPFNHLCLNRPRLHKPIPFIMLMPAPGIWIGTSTRGLLIM